MKTLCFENSLFGMSMNDVGLRNWKAIFLLRVAGVDGCGVGVISMWLGGHEKCGFYTCLGYTFPSTEVHVSIDTSLQFGATLVTRPLVLMNTQSCVFVICACCFWIRLGSHSYLCGVTILHIIP
jgi:hypothetical protein